MSTKKHYFSRRTFNMALGGALIAHLLPLKSIALSIEKKNSSDGLIHYTENGYLNVYSGAGHINLYSSENPISLIQKKMNIPENRCSFIFGENPIQLPGLLSQHINHLSFSSLKTNEKAVETLNAKISEIGRGLSKSLKNKRMVIIEKGVSQRTREITNQIRGNGIIVAVKEVI